MFPKNWLDRKINVREAEKRRAEEENVPLEKSDMKAMLVAALRVFGPILLIPIVLMGLFIWFFG
jgi:hypothetical protein